MSCLEHRANTSWHVLAKSPLQYSIQIDDSGWQTCFGFGASTIRMMSSYNAFSTDAKDKFGESLWHIFDNDDQ